MADQQGQLHMNLEEQEGGGEVKQQQGHQLLNVGLMQGGMLPNNQAYLNGCSTVTAFKSNKYLKGVTKVHEGIKINCNAGTVSTNLKGNYGRLKVWYLPDRIANIFSMHELERLYLITYDSWGGLYVIHTLRGEVRFHKDNQGLPYINLDRSDEQATAFLLQMVEQQAEEKNNDTPSGEGMTLAQTVCGNNEGFMKREMLRAQARRAQAMLGNPSKRDFQGMVSGNIIPNCPITWSNISSKGKIFGPDLASMRGKTVRWMLAPVVADYVAVPWQLVEANKAVTLVADVFFMNGMAFLVTVLRRIKFVMAEQVLVRTATSLSKHLSWVLLVYRRVGFRVRHILMNREFEKIKGLMPTVECNTTAAKEHMSEAERTIRTIKERNRGIVMTLPFTHNPQRMKIEFVCYCGQTHFPSRQEYLQCISCKNYLCGGGFTTKSTAGFFQGHTKKCMMSLTHQTLWSLACTKGLHWAQQGTYQVALSSFV